MLKLTILYTRLESNYSTCTSRSSENICVAAMQALRKKKETEDEAQFTTQICGKTSSFL
jgi:hypothetical protein